MNFKLQNCETGKLQQLNNVVLCWNLIFGSKKPLISRPQQLNCFSMTHTKTIILNYWNF